MKIFKKAIVFLIAILILNINQQYLLSLEDQNIFKGYITNKKFNALLTFDTGTRNIEMFGESRAILTKIKRSIERWMFLPCLKVW